MKPPEWPVGLRAAGTLQPEPALERSHLGEAVAQTPAVQISCQDLTNAIWRFEPNHSSQAVEGSQEPSDDAGPELASARFMRFVQRPSFTRQPRAKARATDKRLGRSQLVRSGHAVDVSRGFALPRKRARLFIGLRRSRAGSFISRRSAVRGERPPNGSLAEASITERFSVQ